MSLSAQAKSLAALGAIDRLSIFGINPAGTVQKGRMQSNPNTAQTFNCYFSPVRSQEQLDAALMKEIHDSILRVAKTETYFTPTIGANVILLAARNDNTDMVLRISELGHSGVNPEYVLGCKAVF